MTRNYTSRPRIAVVMLCLTALLAVTGLSAADVTPLPQAHAHNDYEHERPLLDALDNGFCSVEADIWLVDGKLLVAHDREDVRPERTLEALYLDPLQNRVKRNGGKVYPEGPDFTLLIDLKSEPLATYAALRKVLANYDDMLTSVSDGRETRRAVTAVLSGERSDAFYKMLAGIDAEGTRRAGIDGRLSDLDSEVPSHLMPLISDRWTSHFRYHGGEEMAADEREKLTRIVHQAHEHGRRVRFWATPHNEDLWQELVDAGVDHVNADDLPRLRAFLSSQPNDTAESN
ncbi:MAG: phosphatidylinositol-specific phospholipase C/glycerophosphodiester phosphodiesterase family protein [Pirellulales bacterium]